MLHISIAAETLFTPFSFPITNALITTWIVMAILTVGSLALTTHLKRRPGVLQTATEMIIGGLFEFFIGLGGKHGNVFAPLAVTIFLFVLVSNWIGLLPGVGTIGFFEEGAAPAHALVSRVQAVTEVPSNDVDALQVPATTEAATQTAESHKTFVPLFRAPTADLNTTLALALIVVITIQYYGLKYGGLGYLKKFVDIKSPIGFFVGLLEIVSDISKIISFAFRLFGNVFAGEVLLAVMAFLFAFFLPIPFYGLEIFVGLIQALVFGMLTVVFTSIAVSHGEHAQDGH